ncbi:hypothetical protein K466DRAFT_379380 [Polyporus arcularius HHB13444]|uniref:Uncharacterized protein n=1 Tax=Polyporus arcularius HHB13444 TaxID=1314778 RepID=A0A5C3PMP2_9APHY|nr:hypothetical protein K466DRAFT_379380 [Polyporus arcularius HHB13444]
MVLSRCLAQKQGHRNFNFILTCPHVLRRLGVLHVVSCEGPVCRCGASWLPQGSMSTARLYSHYATLSSASYAGIGPPSVALRHTFRLECLARAVVRIRRVKSWHSQLAWLLLGMRKPVMMFAIATAPKANLPEPAPPCHLLTSSDPLSTVTVAKQYSTIVCPGCRWSDGASW